MQQHPIPTAEECAEIYQEMLTNDAPHDEALHFVALAVLCEKVAEMKRKATAAAEREAEEARRDAAPYVAAWRRENAS